MTGFSVGDAVIATTRNGEKISAVIASAPVATIDGSKAYYLKTRGRHGVFMGIFNEKQIVMEDVKNE